MTRYQVEVTPYESYAPYFVYFDTEVEAKRYVKQLQMSYTVITEITED